MSKWDNAKEAGSGGAEYPMWNPEEQKTIEGVYKAKRTKVGPNDSNVYVLQNDAFKSADNETGEMGVWGSTVIDGQFEDGSDGNGIPLGSDVQITYLGKERGKRAEYKNFKVLYIEPETGSDGRPKSEDNKDRPATDDDIEDLFGGDENGSN